MIVTLTPNPALDLTYHLERLEVGAAQRVPPAQVRAGGKGVNVARVLHDQGHDVRVVAPVGGSTGATFTADLDSAGLPHSLLPVAPATRGTVAIVTPESTTNLNESGAALTEDEWQRLLDLTADTLRPTDAPRPTHRAQDCPQGTASHAPRARLHPVGDDETRSGASAVLVCSGSLPLNTPRGAIAHLVDVAHAHGARCIVDTSSAPHLLAAADAGADVLKPNHHELLAIIGGDDVLAAARTLANRGGAVVYASLGAAGLLRVPPDGDVLHARLSRSLTGNTTGAGDAAVAAIAASLIVDATPRETLRLATAWSAAAVLHPLAGSITDPEPLLADIAIDIVTATPALED